MIRKRLVTLLLLLCLLFAFAAPVHAIAPQNTWIASVQSAVGDAVGKDTAGAVAVIFQNGERTMLEGFGYADLAASTPVSADTLFEIGEISALFTAVAALRLACDGALDMDADIATYVPETVYRRLSLTRTVSVRDLLTGNAGFEARTLDTAFGKSSYRFSSLEEALLTDIPAQTLPVGTRLCVPSAFAVTLAAYVLECVSGVPYDEYVFSAVLEPMGMQNTVLCPMEDDVVAVGYTAENGVFRADKNGGRTYSVLYPFNGAVSTAGDLSRFVQWLLSEEKQDPVLPLAYKSELFRVLTVADLFDSAALVFRARGATRGIETSTAGFGAALWLDTGAKNAVLMLTNTAVSSLLSLPHTLCAAEQIGVSSFSADGELPALKTFRGSYGGAQNETHTFVGKVAAANDTLKVSVNKKENTITVGERRLRQIAPGVFADADSPDDLPVARFLMNTGGEVTALVFADGETYLPIPSYRENTIAMILLAVTVIAAAWFLLSGVFAAMRAVAERNGASRGLLALLTPLSAMLLAIFVLLQVLLGMRYGGTILSSFYTVCSVIALFLIIITVLFHLVAYWKTMFERTEHRRVVHNATLLVIFAVLCFYWHLAYR